MKFLAVLLFAALLVQIGLAASVESAERDASREERKSEERKSEEKKSDEDRGSERAAVVTNESSKVSSSSSNKVEATSVKVKRPSRPKIVKKPAITQVVQKPVVQRPVIQKSVVHQMGLPQSHIDMIPMSGGVYAVEVDNSVGQHLNYLSVGRQIQLLPQEVFGVNQYLLPATDLVSRKQSLVHLGSSNGHLVLSDLDFHGQHLRGFQGWDDFGQVMVPVRGVGQEMVVQPTLHRLSSF